MQYRLKDIYTFILPQISFETVVLNIIYIIAIDSLVNGMMISC